MSILLLPRYISEQIIFEAADETPSSPRLAVFHLHLTLLEVLRKMQSTKDQTNEEKTMLKGSCYCSAIHFSSSTLPSAITLCHCVPCQKLSGSPYIPWGKLLKAAISWQGNSIRYSESELAVRSFCALCGSSLEMTYKDSPDTTYIAMGTIDEEMVIGSLPKPHQHIFLKSKASWLEISEDDGSAKHRAFPG